MYVEPTHLSDKEKALTRRRAAAQSITRAAWERTKSMRAQLQTVDEGHPCLRYLKREERLAWLALQVYSSHEKEHPISLGPGYGYEIVTLATSDPNYKAMDMLMRACGDYGPGGGAQVAVSVNGVAGSGNRPPQIVRKTVLYLPPGRGPAPPDVDVIEVGAAD